MDRSDEVVVGTTEKSGWSSYCLSLVFFRIAEEQRGDAKDARCVGVSEVKCKNLVERCVVLRNAGRLLLHGNLWDRWSRGLSFVKEMSEGSDVRETESEQCRSQSMFAKEGILFQVEIRVRHRGVEHVLLRQGWTDKESREELRDDCVQMSEGDWFEKSCRSW